MGHDYSVLVTEALREVIEMSESQGGAALPVLSYRWETERPVRPAKVLLGQNGPATPDKGRNVANMVELRHSSRKHGVGSVPCP